MKISALRKVVLREVVDRARMRTIILARWQRSEDPRDRVRLSAVAEHLAAELGAEMSWKFRRRARAAAEFSGFRRVVTSQGVPSYRFMRERARG